jgi:hypothetical protein
MALTDIFTQSMGGARSVDGMLPPMRQPRHQLSQGNQLVKMFARQQGGSQFGGNEPSQDMMLRQQMQGQL